jgi:predicted RNA methylase
MEQDTGKFRKNTKDQYYTKGPVAKKCVDLIHTLCPATSSYQWIEPSAGNGAFLQCIPVGTEKIGIDLDPKSDGIQRGDFLTWTPITEKKRIFFGNPPFGRQSSTAKAFIKHAAQYADIIAFILPRSFVKPSMSRAFPLEFHCLHSEELEQNAFEVNGEAYDVPCVFQIWEKRDTAREVQQSVKERGFSYVKHGEPFDIAFKRVGGLAGKCVVRDTAGVYNPQYHYFLKLDPNHLARLQSIVEHINQHVFPSNTVGPRSLSKGEVNEVINEILEV